MRFSHFTLIQDKQHHRATFIQQIFRRNYVETFPPTSYKLKPTILHFTRNKCNISRFFNNLLASQLQQYAFPAFPSSTTKLPHNSNMTGTPKRPRTSNDDTEMDPTARPTLVLPDFDPETCNPINSMRDHDHSPNIFNTAQRKAYALRYSLNIYDFELDITALVQQVSQVLYILDPEFTWVKTEDNQVIPETELKSTNLTMKQIEEYSSPLDINEYYNKKMYRWTMVIMTTEFYIGGYLFNWLKQTSPRQSIRSSPNIGVFSAEIAWFTWTTMFTTCLEKFNQFLDEEVFDRNIQRHTFEKKFNLRNDDFRQPPDWTKGICLEVPDHEADYATERIYRKLPNGESIFSRFSKNIRPIPLLMHRRNTKQFELFMEQKRWYMRGFSKFFIRFPDGPTADDLQMIEYINSEKHPENPDTFIVKTSDYHEYTVPPVTIVTCWKADYQTVRSLLLNYMKNNNINADIGRPPRSQVFQSHWASLGDTRTVVSDMDSASLASHATNIISPYASQTHSSSLQQAISSPSGTSSVTSVPSSILRSPPKTKQISFNNENTLRTIVRDEIKQPIDKMNNRIDKLTRNFTDMQANNDMLQDYQNKIYEQQRRINTQNEQNNTTIFGLAQENTRKIRKVATAYNHMAQETTNFFSDLNDAQREGDVIEPPKYRLVVFEDDDDTKNKKMPAQTAVDVDMTYESQSTPKSPYKEGNLQND